MTLDQKINECNYKIRKNYTVIESNCERIRFLEQEIDDLRLTENKIQNVYNTLQTTTNASKSTFNQIFSVVKRSIISFSFFGSLNDILNGPEFNKANDSLINSINKIENQIKMYQEEISDLQNENYKLNTENKSLMNKKAMYYTQKSQGLLI